MPASLGKSTIADDYDVAIVGAGIVGVTLAYRMRSHGARVILIEALEVLEGVTGYTTAKLTAQHGLIYSQLPEQDARIYYDFNRESIEFVRNSGIPCDLLECVAVVRAEELDHHKDLTAEAETYQRIGIPGGLDGPDRIRMDGQAAYHPRKFLLHLLEEAQQAGVAVATHSRVNSVDEDEDGCHITIGDRIIRAAQVCIATHFPIHDSDLFITKLTPVRSYASAFRLESAPLSEMVITHEEETFRSYRPVVLEDGAMGVIVGSVHHRVGEAPAEEDPYADIEQWARANFPVVSCEARWSTQDLWTPDGLPYIGLSPHRKRTFMATGFGGWGMTTGIAAAGLLEALMTGNGHPAAELFSPARNPIKGAKKLVVDNLVTAKHLVGDKFSGLTALDTESLAPGQATIGIEEGERRAAFRDADGNLHKVASSCTHMGCQLLWNELEATWDCPCHGSRFTHTGQVLHGPATTPLPQR